MNCTEFADWLDRGGPEEASARRHAEQCAACAASLRGAEELERALRTPLAVAPADFTDRVMRRLPAISERTAPVPDDPDSPWPWWIQILFEPSAALGLALGLLYAVAAPRLLGAEAPFLSTLVERLGSALALEARQAAERGLIEPGPHIPSPEPGRNAPPAPPTP